eukprot:scaffold2681_cov73-Phaeocystis_antarctica.AAC.2
MTVAYTICISPQWFGLFADAEGAESEDRTVRAVYFLCEGSPFRRRRAVLVAVPFFGNFCQKQATI